MSWDQYIVNLMASGCSIDAAIVGYLPEQEGVWASHPGGDFQRITPSEIKQLMRPDRSSLLSSGVMLGNTKCTVLRDGLSEEGVYTMDLRTKASDKEPNTYNICISKTNQALVILKGMKDAHGGKLNISASNMGDYLRKAGF